MENTNQVYIGAYIVVILLQAPIHTTNTQYKNALHVLFRNCTNDSNVKIVYFFPQYFYYYYLSCSVCSFVLLDLADGYKKWGSLVMESVIDR